jgi:hypothetical protein
MKQSFPWVLLSLMSVLLLACDKMPKIGPPDEAQNKLATASQDDCGFVQNSYGQRVSWKKNLPLRIYLDPSFPAIYEPSLREAAQKWEAVVGRTLFVFERLTATTAPNKDGRNIAYLANPWPGGNSQLQAVSNLNWYGNQMIEADLLVNSQDYSFYVDDPATTHDVHMTSLLVHELGHFLGLKHVSGTSVMVTVLDYLLKREVPTEDDKAHIRCEYN